MSDNAVFSIQDDTGRVAQVHIQDHGEGLPVVGDQGQFSQDGETDLRTFTVTQVIDTQTFSVTFSTDSDAVAVSKLAIPFSVTWLSGAANTTEQVVDQYDGANAYISVDQFKQYHNSRGNDYSDSPVESIQYAIVKATDYIDQKYRFKGVKLSQVAGDPLLDPTLAFIDPFLSPIGIGFVPALTAAVTAQTTEWPRQGVTDYNGASIAGIPRAVKAACAELANRELNGTDLQPDYDSELVSAGGVVQSFSETVGPITVSKTFDTRLGTGFFASFPHVDRMLAKAGLLLAGGGRTVLR